jgi:hypothetical protein
MANKKISQLPYIGVSKISGNTLVPLVTYFSGASGDTVHTYVNDLKTFIISGITGNTSVVGNYLPLSGGTVTGATTFTSGLTTNTISATTYQNLPVSGLTAGSNINLGVSNGNYTISVTGITGGSTFTGGTVSGATNFTNGLSANTISATTYQNLPVSGLTAGSNINVSGSSGNYTISVTGITGGLTGSYLPLSGGTVTGATIFTSGLTANTLNVTGLTQTKGITSTGGITFKQVTINGSYTATTDDYMIDITGGTFTVSLPTAVGVQGRLIVVKNNGGGAVTVDPFGSETIDGKSFVILGETNSIQLASNGTEWVALGYNISTVNSSTGVFEFTGMTIASPTTFTVAPIKGWIVDDTTNPLSPQLYYVYYSGGTHTATYVTTATETWVYLTSGGTISQSNIELTEQQRRQNIFLGKLGHANKTNIINAFSQPDFVLSPLSQLRDMFNPIGFINGGIYASPNGVNLSFNTSAGYLYGLGINFANDTLNPNSLYVSGTAPCTFQYRTQTGGTTSNTTSIDPTVYDNGGVVTSIPGSGGRATNQRIYLVQNGIFRVQYGQTFYNSLSAAIEGIATEQFNTFSNFTNNGILIGVLSVRKDATDLSDTSKARFFFTSKFGETVGAAGGISTTTLQQAYNNSVTPEITTDSTLGALSVKNGAGTLDNVTNVFEGVNAAGTTTSFVRADGAISGTTIFGAGLTASTISATTYQNLPLSATTYVSGGTYSAGTITFTNTSGGTFEVTGLTTGDTTTTITGATSVGTGLTIFDNVVNRNIQIKSITGDSLNKITATTNNNTIEIGINEQNLTIWDLVVQGNRLLSGNVSYISGLTFSVSPLEYLINGTIYDITSATTVTLNSGDSTYDRIDVIYADISGNTGVLEGSPSENPEKPLVDGNSEVEVTFVLVPANSTSADITTFLIYNENAGPPTEWTFGSVGLQPTRIIGSSTGQTYSGSTAIRVSGVTGAFTTSFRLTGSTTLDTNQYATLQFAMRNLSANTTTSQIRIRFLTTGGTQNGNTVLMNAAGSSGFVQYSSNNTSSWQLISIPLWRFYLTNTNVQVVEFSFYPAGVGDQARYYFDLLEFVEGTSSSPPSNSWTTIKGDSATTITAPNPNATLTISGGTNISSSISGTSTVVLNLDDNINLNGVTASTISATTYQNLPSSTFTGGTVNGSTNFTNGLTANTISATTYQNLPVSALTAGTNISITNTSGNRTISVTGITGGSTFTGGTVSGSTNFTNGLTANTISATTYQNLPVSGITAGSNINISGSSGNYTISVTGITGGLSGDYLPLSGGTVSGDTTITANLTVSGNSGINWFSSNTTSDLVRITQTGNGNAFVVEDSTNPDSTPFIINTSGNTSIGSTSFFTTPGSGLGSKLSLSLGGAGVAYSGLPITTVMALESNQTTAIGLFSPNASSSQIYFGTPSDLFGALLRWDFTNKNLLLSTANSDGKISFATGIGDEAASIDKNGNFGIGLSGVTLTQKFEVSGNTRIYGGLSAQTATISGSGQNVLTVIGSGNSATPPIFTVQGSSGELFGVNDSLVGSLFSVNDISGLPIVEVFSDNTTLWGSYQSPSLNTTTKVTLTAGTNTIYSIPTSAYTGAFYEYTLISTGTTGARAGQIMSIWSGSSINFTETSTTDIGTTTGVTFTVAVSGNNAVLSSSATTAGWIVKTIIRSI